MLALPSLNRVIVQEISWTELVNGAAIDASVSLREMPTSADLSAAQSLAPSPHIPIYSSRTSLRLSISKNLSSGDILA